MNLKLDCRHFRGDKPCIYKCGCESCRNYSPMGTRILIIKLDAIGDVARTTPLLRPLRQKYNPCHITWLVHPVAQELLVGNSFIDSLLPYTLENLEALRAQRFDVVLSLDKTARATAVATWINSGDKRGFGLNEFGSVYPINAESHYAFALGIDDDLKFQRNKKTYQEIIFECVGLPYSKEEYALPEDDVAKRHTDEVMEKLGLKHDEVLVGLNLGGGSAFVNKMWDALSAIDFIIALLNEVDCRVLLFGAQREQKTIQRIMDEELPRVYHTGIGNSIKEFQSLLGRCATVVTGDSLGMHLAIAQKRPVVALFGPTCAQEIELYGRGEKIISALPCAPCYSGDCKSSPNCMEAIEPKPVVEAVKRWLAHEKKLKLAQ